MKFWSTIVATSLIVLSIGFLLNTDLVGDLLLPRLPKVSFASSYGPRDISDESVSQIVIKVPDAKIGELRNKLVNRTRSPSVYGLGFSRGFNADYHWKLMNYWLSNYQWKRWEDQINKFRHYFTRIKGLQIHYTHYRASSHTEKEIIPILLLHGWPGSFFEFYKFIPYLNKLAEDKSFEFEIVCPSLVGFGWSDMSNNPDFSLLEMSDVLFQLMSRLNITRKFYIQGGDFGSLLAELMSKIAPNKVAGIHVNLVGTPFSDWRYLFKVWIGSMVPSSIHFLSPEELDMVYPWTEKIKSTIENLGYFWFQATRPSTIGISLSDSPSGLAAYILEKFAAWSTNTTHHFSSSSGGLEDLKISKDEMLTNVMIYYITNTITSSMIYYKDFRNTDISNFFKVPVVVPTGIALFPNELVRTPRPLAKIKYRNIKQFTYMREGGHFAALEEPEMLAKDVLSFVELIESS